MKAGTTILIITLVSSHIAISQNSFQFTWNPGKDDLPQFAFVSDVTGDQDDPAYQVYRAGYNLVLEERWEEAGKKMSEVISKYPKSNYVDEAQYWYSYSLKHIDKKRAIAAYTKFIEAYPESKYYDDALADLAELKKQRSKIVDKLTVTEGARVYVTGDGLYMNEGVQRMHIGHDGIVIGEGPESLIVEKRGITIRSEGRSFRYGYGFAPRAKTLERALQLHVKRINRLSSVIASEVEEKKSNPEIRLKIDALYALGDGKEDAESFRTLKEVALDFKQPAELREAALYTLADFKKMNVFSVFIDIVKLDTNEDMQAYAIDYISQYERDKEKTISLLIDLFNDLPAKRKEQRQMIFYSIADIGNDRAIDFLSRIAQENDDYDLRREAVYYLGSIGGEKARSALYGILKRK